MRVIALLLLFVAGSARAALAQPHTIHVVTPSGDKSGSEIEKGLADSTADVRKALEDRKYQTLFTVVESPDAADLLLEVTWRGQLETTKTVTSTGPVPGTTAPLGSQQKALHDNLRVTLTAGSYEREFWAVDPHRTSWFGNLPHLLWRNLARQAADNVAKWVRENRIRLKEAVDGSRRP